MRINYTNAYHEIYESHINLLDVRYGSPLTEEQKRLNEFRDEMRKNSTHFIFGNHFPALNRVDYPDYRVYSIINPSKYYL